MLARAYQLFWIRSLKALMSSPWTGAASIYNWEREEKTGKKSKKRAGVSPCPRGLSGCKPELRGKIPLGQGVVCSKLRHSLEDGAIAASGTPPGIAGYAASYSFRSGAGRTEAREYL